MSIHQAAIRTIKVWFRGLAFYTSGISLLTQWYAYRNLQRTGETSWDKEGCFTVSQETLSTPRVIWGIFIIIICQTIVYFLNHPIK